MGLPVITGKSRKLNWILHRAVQATPSVEFQNFLTQSKEKNPEEFCQWWNSQKAEWTFSYYNQNGLKWPDSSTAEEIYTSKIVNCYRISKLCQAIYGGEIVYVTQVNSEYDHCYLRLKDGKIDNCGLELKWTEF